MSIIDPPVAPDFTRIGRGYTLKRLPNGMQDARTTVGEVLSGDPDNFNPNTMLRRWNSECEFGLKFPDVVVSGRTVTLDAEKIVWNHPSGYRMRWFDRPTDTSFFGITGGAFEFDLLIPSLPPAGPNQNKVTFTLVRTNCRLAYQDPVALGALNIPTLTSTTPTGRICKWQSIEHYNRVAGSYAVLHSTKSGGKYRNGKITHLFTPKAIDALGASTPCSYNSDAQTTGLLTFTVPLAWFQAATFPVLIDPEFGYHTVGGTTDNTGNYQLACQFQFTGGTGSKLTDVGVYINGADSGTYRAAIYSDTGSNLPNAKLEESTFTSAAASWCVATMAGTLSLTNNALYWLVVCPSGAIAQFDTKYDADASPITSYHAQGGVYTLPATWTSDGTLNRKVSIYATYTPPYVDAVATSTGSGATYSVPATGGFLLETGTDRLLMEDAAKILADSSHTEGTAVWNTLGASAGVGAATADGDDIGGGGTIVEADGSSAGVAVATGTSASVLVSMGASTGLATPLGTGANTFVGIGSSAGLATSSVVGTATTLGVGSSAGLGTTTGLSAALWNGVGSVTSAATISGIASALWDSLGSSGGTSASLADSLSVVASAASSAGSSTATALDLWFFVALGGASGTGTVLGVSSVVRLVLGNAAGSSTATGDGFDAASGSVAGAAGTSSATAVGRMSIHGVTKDSSGNPLGTCVVKLFQTSDDILQDEVTSSASGVYAIYPADGTGPFYAVAYKANSPDVAGTTVNTLVAS